MQDPDSAKRHVLEKFKKKGFHHLTLEELAITQVSPNWPEEFKAAINEDWSVYQEKVSDRLSRAKFNMKWLTREQTSSFSNLFSVVIRGDLKMLEEFVRINNLKACKQAVDDSKKTCLHLACREGHSAVVEYLITQGWSIEARDKLLCTPLHLACTSGHANIVAYLILKGADCRAKDSLGRNSLLFAVCSPSTETVEVLLKHERSLIDSKDYTGRSSLHYAIFNPHQRQVDIIRTLLEAGISVDIPDDELKTPMHHACDASKPRGIRLLIKWGANLSARDRTGKTPYDLALNPNIKQLVSLYTKTKQDDVKNSRLSSEKLPKISQKVAEFRPSTPVQAPTTGFKEKLIGLLRKVQETGVLANQHIKKPSLYSGAWVEGIVNTAALHNELSSSQPTEAVIKVFNVLFPYPKVLPVPQDDEISGLEFFGTGAYKTPRQEAVYIQDDGKSIRLQNQLDSAEQNIKELQHLLMGKDSIIQELQTALKIKAAELQAAQNSVQEIRDKYQETLRLVPTADEVKARELEKQRLLEQIKVLQVRFEDSEKRAKELKGLAESLKIEIEQRPSRSEVEALKLNIKELQADDRNLRFKAGQLFLGALESSDNEDAGAPEANLQDDEVLQRLEKSLFNNPPGLKQRLTEADSNKDGKVTKGEVAKVIGTLLLPPQDIIVILRIVGFRKGVPAVPIEVITNVYSSREQRKENLENSLFAKLIETFEKNSMTIDQAFDYLDVNDDGKINFQELSEVCETLRLNLNREDRHSLFAVLDSDHSGEISLEELKGRLEKVPPPAKPIKIAQPKLPNSRYKEPQDLTPTSSVKEETRPPELTKAQKAPVKGVEVIKTSETLNKAETKVPVEAQKQNKRLNGSLVVGVVRGKALGAGSVYAQVRIDGGEKVLKTPVMQGPDPEWKFKGRLRLYDTSTTLVSTEVIIELSNDKGILGTARVPWGQTLDFPNSWAVKSEYPVLEPNGRRKGSVFIHLNWCPKDAIRIEGAGVLSVQIESFSGFPKSILQFTVSSCNTLLPLEKDGLVLIKDLVLKPTSPVPSLKCSILNAVNKEEILWRNLSIEVALATKGWTPPLSVPLNGGYALALKFLWTPQTPEEEKTLKAVIRIQSMFRGMRARKDFPLKKSRTNRRVVGRKVLKREKKYFLLFVLDQDDNFLLELHEVDDPDVPMYEVISSLTIPKQPLNDIFEKVSVSVKKEIVLEASLPETCGSLGIEIVNCTCPIKAFTRFEHAKEFVHSNAGPPWGKKLMMPLITFSQFHPLKLTLISVDKREEIAKSLIDWQHALKSSDKMTEEKVFELGKHSITLKFLWSQKPPIKQIPLDKPEEGLKKKSLRKLVGRKGLSRNKKYYLISIFDSAGIIEFELHTASDPSIPMYQVLDKVVLSTLQDWKTVIETSQVSKDNKLIIDKKF